MNIQIYGSKKCFDTRKAQRFFQERQIKFQYIELGKYGLSKKELASVKAAVGMEKLINTKAKEYKDLSLHRVSTDNSSWDDILLNNPNLYSTPIVRNGRQATVGYRPDVWAGWE